jgi:TP901 family phage tail tape measure protein
MAFTIPSIFTAIDKFSAPLKGMGRNVQAFAAKTEAGVARSERMFRKLTPALSSASKEFLSFASTAAASAAIVGGVSFSVKSLKDYENALASFRTIVSDLSDKDFAKFEDKIGEVAKETRKSSIDVAASFEKIAGLNATFAETSEGIGAVSKAAILLSKASKDDLGVSAENLVGIMNQFSLGALEADRVTNVLAAGQAVGAASISQSAEAYKNFGSVAKGANITLEQSQGLIQTLAKFSVVGAESGTKLRGSILKLQQAGVGYKSGQFKVNDALEEARAKIDKLKTAKQKDAALTKMFGAENISTGRILLSNIEIYKKYTEGVTGTSEAQKAADINSKTLTVAINELKSAWINMLTGSNKAKSGLNAVRKVIVFITDNLDTIVSIGTKVLLFFAVWKTLLIASRIALIGYNVVLGITGALSGTASIAIGANSVALGAYKVTLWLATAAQYALNVAMSLNPVALVVVGVLALVAALGYVIANYESIESLHKKSTEKTRLQSMKDEGEIIRSNTLLYQKKGRSIEEARRYALMESKGQLDFDIAKVNEQVAKASTDSEKRIAQLQLADIEGRKAALKDPQLFEDQKPAINPELQRQESLKETISTQKQNVSIDIKDKGNNAKVSSDSNMIPIKTTSTVGF